MNIITSFSKWLKSINESSGNVHDYGCAMVYYDLPQLSDIHSQIDPDDIYTELDDASYGLEDEPHTTLLFGFHSDVDADDVLHVCNKFEYPHLMLHNASCFNNDSNVALYLPIYNGNVLATKIQTPILTTGSNVTGGTMTGTWTLSTGSQLQATYADLAERFEADAEYDPGTVVELGGEKEITEVALDLSDTVFGVVSNTAAYLMNSGAGTSKTHPAIAVSGRVQVKVSGRVKKGDRLVSAGKGKARAAQIGEASAFNTIGRSLVNKDDEGTGTVEAIVTIK